MRLARVRAVAHKEWREIVRDRIYFLLAFVIPPFMMLVFGYGISQDVEHVPFAVVDYDHSAMSRDYANHYIPSRYFRFEGYLKSAHEADALLAGGRLGVVFVIPERFQQELLAGRTIAIQTLVDGAFISRARTVLGYVEAINGSANSELRAAYLARQAGIPIARADLLLRPVRIEVRYLYNEELRSIWGIAPSLIMFVLILTAPMLTALSVVRERETGAIYNIYASTISRAEFLAGKLLPNVLISSINAVVLWLMAMFYFGVPFRGDFPFFFAVTWLYVVCASGIGLVVSLLVRTQQAALIVSVVFSTIVAISFSGMITPVSSLGGFNRVLAHLFPAMYYNDAVQAVFLKGSGSAALWPQAAVLAVYSAVMIGAARLLFHKRISR